MAISVTCPSCLKRFSVSDKFAGKSGPCPSCQKPIKIPEKADEVVIHAPEDAAPKDSKGRSVLKPIRRTEVNLSMPVILSAALGSFIVFGLALGLGLSGGAPTWLLAAASILMSLPLVMSGYWFLHDDELEAFRGRPLIIRAGICGLAFAAAWGVYAFVPQYVTGESEIGGLQVAVLLPIMIALGTFAAVLSLELELLQGVLLYAFYLGVTLILAWLSGAPLTGAKEAGNGRVPQVSPPAIQQPGSMPANPKQPGISEPTAPTAPSNGPVIPKLLQ